MNEKEFNDITSRFQLLTGSILISYALVMLELNNVYIFINILILCLGLLNAYLGITKRGYLNE